jgi:hypothetical protein
MRVNQGESNEKQEHNKKWTCSEELGNLVWSKCVVKWMWEGPSIVN